MRILVTTGIYPPSIGGPASYSKLLKDELPKRGIDVSILSYDEVRKYPKGVSHFIFLLKIISKSFGKDLIYAQDPVSVGFPTMLAAKLLNKKYVLKVVGDYAWEQGVGRFGVKDNLDDFVKDNSLYRKEVYALKKTQKKVAENAEKIIVPSRYLKKIVSRWGIDEDKISVIYNAFEIPEGVRKDLSDKKRLISVGRLVSWKGMDTLISIMPRIIKQFPNVELKIIGDGPERKKLEREIYKFRLEDRVEIMGAMPKEQAHYYLKNSDVFVLNTNYEGFSHLILESLALETPIITTSVGGNIEIIEDGENGFLIDFNDKEALVSKILRLLSDEGLRDSFAEKGKDKISNFGKEKMLSELVDELKSVK